MRQNSRFLSVTAASLAALALAGCSGKAPEASESEAAAPVEEASVPAVDASEAAPVAEASASVAAAAPSASPTLKPTATPSPEPTPSAKPVEKKAPAPAPSPSAKAEQVAAVTPPASFARCAVCHNAAKGAGSKIGPNLWGVYGTKAGEIKGYNFSDALKSSGLTWNDATLDEWIAGPMQMVPGTMMSFPGIKNPEKRAEIIAFLKSAR